MRYILFLFIVGFGCLLNAQQPYQFTEVLSHKATPVISQGRTGTCWSFSTSSFLESEIMRLSGKMIDLSEMYIVRNTYPKKAENYVMRQGKAQFSEGGLAHDVINSIRDHGLAPIEAYTGLSASEENHNHAELVAILEAMVSTYVANPGKALSKHWEPSIAAVLDVYLGKFPQQFTYEGQQYTPKDFLKMTQLQPEDYISITSFTQAPFYSEFILNIPDNWSYGSFYNVPLDEMMNTIDNALEKGFTVALDCDVSERTFSSKDGVAVIPLDPENNIKALQGVFPERKVSQEYRQEQFDNFTTTDDHLMHITGILRDQNGTKYYKVKNSWGTDETRNANGGYVYFSEAYMRAKAISVMVHKDAVPIQTAKKLNL